LVDDGEGFDHGGLLGNQLLLECSHPLPQPHNLCVCGPVARITAGIF
jgi:hypothetical protein